MNIFLDNLSALMISMSVLFILVATQLHSQRAAQEQTTLYISKKQTLEFADVLEQDLKTIGKGMSEHQRLTTVTTNATGQTDRFVFWATDDTDTPIEIEYSLSTSGTVSIDDATVTLYQVTRTENGVATGQSPSTLREFVLEPLDESGTSTTPNHAKLIRVRFVNVMPLGRPEQFYLRNTYWGLTIRPHNLD